MPKTNDAALDAFIAAKAEIDAMLTRLVAHSADHFGYGPPMRSTGAMSARWSTTRIRLCEITDMTFCEGEHAA